MLFALFVSTIVTGLALTLFLPVFWCAIVAILTFLVTAVIDVRDQSAVRMLIFACLNVFFRDIETRNSHTIPKKGPLILVCKPSYLFSTRLASDVCTSRRISSTCPALLLCSL